MNEYHVPFMDGNFALFIGEVCELLNPGPSSQQRLRAGLPILPQPKYPKVGGGVAPCLTRAGCGMRSDVTIAKGPRLGAGCDFFSGFDGVVLVRPKGMLSHSLSSSGVTRKRLKNATTALGVQKEFG